VILVSGFSASKVSFAIRPLVQYHRPGAVSNLALKIAQVYYVIVRNRDIADACSAEIVSGGEEAKDLPLR